ncbi:MAG TPA: DUF1552 domain-containing protein [Humisphaera sp.]
MRSITNPLSRRTFLRGAGVAMTLPLLDAMSPRVARAAEKPGVGGDGVARRMVFICTTLGIHGPNFFPEGPGGRDYKPSPYLATIADYRNDFTVFSGVCHPDVDGGHASEASYLTSAPHPGSSSFRNTVSVDQVVAEKIGAETRFPYLALGTARGSLSVTRNGTQIPSDRRPSVLFKKLFLTGTAKEVDDQVRRLKEGQSIMDTVRGETRRLQGEVGADDRRRLDEYFTSVREVEQRLTKAEAWSRKPKPVVDAKPPTDIANGADIIGRTKLMYDLVALALQTDSTRAITLAVDGMNAVPPIDGVTIDHHNLSHHGRDPEKLAQLRIVEEQQFKAFAGLLAKLKATPEGGKTLLDRTMLVYGSNLGNASAHDTKNMPILLAGGGFKHGQHIAFDETNNAPVCNIFVSMLQRMGIEADAFGSGKGTVRGLEMAAG